MKNFSSLSYLMLLICQSYLIQAMPALPVRIYQGDTLIRTAVRINDITQQDSLYLLIANEGNRVEARNLILMAGAKYFPYNPVYRYYGFTVQYGKLFSFTAPAHTYGFVNYKETLMEPPVKAILIGGDSVYFAPLGFMADALGGTLSYHADEQALYLTINPPTSFGSDYPAAANVAAALTDSGYIVQQADIGNANAIQVCAAGYVSDCNGNNASFPYLVLQLPPPPGMDSLFEIPMAFNFREDEALIAIGKTPPECTYFSYRSYVVNRLYEFPVYERLKIYASMGDTKSLYNMREDLPIDSMFNRKFAIIMAADSLIAMRMKATILASVGDIDAMDIYFDIVPKDIYKFGTGFRSDCGNFLHRISIFKDSLAGQQYITNPPLEIMRVTPSEPVIPVFFAPRSLTPRISGSDEFHLLPDVRLLEDNMYNAYQEDYDITWLQTWVWAPEGLEALQERRNVVGETHDALYVRSESFSFRDNDIVIVYGVNHTKTGMAVYSNVSSYGARYLNGFGGITDTHFEKTAREFISDTTLADHLFVYKFARHPVPGNSNFYIVPLDTLGNLTGINVNDSAFMAFRAYINTQTKVGPDPTELILDRAILLRPKNSGIKDFRSGKARNDLKIYPNPAAQQATLELVLPHFSDVTLSIYNASGQQVGRSLQIDHAKGKVLQMIYFGDEFSPGAYYIHAGIFDQEEHKYMSQNGKILILAPTSR
jgi:hypothetical protein